MNFMKLSADNLDKVFPEEKAFWRWGRDFWCHGNTLGSLSTRSLCPVISETFLGIKVEEKVTSKMHPSNCSKEPCKVIDAVTDCRLPNRGSPLLLPKAFRAIPVIWLHLSSNSEQIYRVGVSYSRHVLQWSNLLITLNYIEAAGLF